MNMIQSSHSGNKDKMSDKLMNGIINPTMLYFFKIFKVWMIRCNLARLTNAIGFILNSFKVLNILIYFNRAFIDKSCRTTKPNIIKLMAIRSK